MNTVVTSKQVLSENVKLANNNDSRNIIRIVCKELLISKVLIMITSAIVYVSSSSLFFLAGITTAKNQLGILENI